MAWFKKVLIQMYSDRPSRYVLVPDVVNHFEEREKSYSNSLKIFENEKAKLTKDNHALTLERDNLRDWKTNMKKNYQELKEGSIILFKKQQQRIVELLEQLRQKQQEHQNNLNYQQHLTEDIQRLNQEKQELNSKVEELEKKPETKEMETQTELTAEQITQTENELKELKEVDLPELERQRQQKEQELNQQIRDLEDELEVEKLEEREKWLISSSSFLTTPNNYKLKGELMFGRKNNTLKDFEKYVNDYLENNVYEIQGKNINHRLYFIEMDSDNYPKPQNYWSDRYPKGFITIAVYGKPRGTDIRQQKKFILYINKEWEIAKSFKEIFEYNPYDNGVNFWSSEFSNDLRQVNNNINGKLFWIPFFKKMWGRDIGQESHNDEENGWRQQVFKDNWSGLSLRFSNLRLKLLDNIKKNEAIELERAKVAELQNKLDLETKTKEELLEYLNIYRLSDALRLKIYGHKNADGSPMSDEKTIKTVQKLLDTHLEQIYTFSISGNYIGVSRKNYRLDISNLRILSGIDFGNVSELSIKPYNTMLTLKLPQIKKSRMDNYRANPSIEQKNQVIKHINIQESSPEGGKVNLVY